MIKKILFLLLTLLFSFCVFSCTVTASAEENEPAAYSDSGLHIISDKSVKYSYKALCADIKELRAEYTDILDYNSIGKTYDNREIYELVLGNQDAENHIIIQSTIHGREYTNSLLVMRQVEAICKNYNNAYKGKKVSQLLDSVCMHIIPMANPDGVTISQYGAKGIKDKKLRKSIKSMCKKYGGGKKSYYTRWKANARGVDINRNFPLKWKSNDSGVYKPGNSFYKGKAAVSERETKALINHYKSVKPKTVIAFHSSGSIIYWDFLQTGELRNRNKSLFITIKKLNGYKDAKASQGKPKLGPYFGEWSGYKMGVPTLTIETGNGNRPLSKKEYKTTWKKNRLVLIETLLWTYNTYK
ncbi:MAG: peptidase M14 [Eubacterium sp.]|nr:peptidase M14 [Eubacterium sp.]